MTRRHLSAKDSAALNAAIAANHQPRAPRAARGLILSIPGGRAKKIMDTKGALTPAGEYFYSQTAQRAPNRSFDYNQEPTRRSNREQVLLLDGQNATVRTWDTVKRRWRFTKTGQEFYKDSVDRYVVTFPMKQVRMKDGHVAFERDGVLKSTATALGEISLPTLMPEDQQLAEVKRQTEAFIASLPILEGHGDDEHSHEKLLLDANSDSLGFGFLDQTRSIEYNREHIDIRPNGEAEVSAVLHRPLRGKPWSFGYAGVCPQAYEETNGRCVQRQMETLTKEQNLEKDFDDIYEELYGQNHDDNPYVIETEDGTTERYNWRDAGITCAMVHAFAVRRSLPVRILWQQTKILSYRPEVPLGSSLCLHVFGDHAFFVNDPCTKSTLAKMKTRKREPAPEAVLAVLRKSTTPPAKEWKEWTGDLEPGCHYFTHDLASARLKLHTEGTCPKVTLNGAGIPKALRIPTENRTTAVVHRWPPEGALCEAFAAEVQRRTGRQVPYKGESLASFANLVFTELLKPPQRRRQLGEELYNKLWRQQGRACNLCGCNKGAKLSVDHIAPRFVGGGDELENLQIICANCHANKTSVEALSFVEDEHPLLSRFSLETYKAFVESPKPPQLVANMREREAGGIGIDVIRCRFNAFVETSHELPIFAPTDEVNDAVRGTLGDYNWIDIGALGPHRSPATALPYTGPRWYTRGAAGMLLDAGIIEWEHVKLTYSAAARRPMSYMAERLRLMDEMWTSVGDSFQADAFMTGRDPRSLAKWASSALFGIWGCCEHFLYTMTTTSCDDDVPAGPATVSGTPGSTVFKDYVTKRRRLGLTSMRPIHQICLEEEHMNMARAQIFARRWCDPKYIYSLRVDELIVHVAKSKVPKFIEAIGKVTYADLADILPPGRKRVLSIQNTSTAPVFRTRFVAEPQPPAVALAIRDAEIPVLPAATWQTRHEPLEGPDNFLDDILEHVKSGGSMIVEGVAGTGKTVVLRAVQSALERAGVKCQAVCLTHTGSRNIGPEACTAHSFVMKHVLYGTFGGTVVLVDEISFMSLDLIAALEHLRLKGVRLICFGDFGQLPPVSNRWRGQSVPPDVFQNSRLSWHWSNGNRFVLQRCRRSDQAHFDFYSGLRHLPLSQALQRAARRYPAKSRCDWNIVLSNYRRKKINEEMQTEAAKKHKGDKLHIDGEVPFDCFVGTFLIGCNSTLAGIVNGAFLKVTAIHDGKVFLKDEDVPGAREFSVTPTQLAKHTRLRWALTLCSVQGRSLPGTIAVHDTKSRHFDTTHLHVGLSRATDGGNVQIMS